MGMTGYYSKFFNLETNPFGETPDPEFYYASPMHHQALSTLLNGIRSGKGFSLLTGEVGTGKTLLARMILGALHHEANTALVLYPKFTEIELLEAVLEEFEVAKSETPLVTVKSYIDHLNEFLLAAHQSGRRSVLVIDEAQLLSAEALETIRLLTNLETSTEKLLQIVLIAQTEIHEVLGRHDLRPLKQRIQVEASVQELSPKETENYIHNRLEKTESGNFIRFEPGIGTLVHQLSRGFPRRINQICEGLIKQAESKGIRLISKKFAREALDLRFSLFAKGKSFMSRLFKQLVAENVVEHDVTHELEKTRAELKLVSNNELPRSTAKKPKNQKLFLVCVLTVVLSAQLYFVKSMHQSSDRGMASNVSYTSTKYSLPTDSELNAEGIRLFKAQDYAGASEQFNLLLKREPNSPEVLNNIGMSFFKQNKLKTASVFFKEAIKKSPMRTGPVVASAYNNLGSIHLEQKLYESAIYNFQKAVLLNHDSTEARLNLGKTYELYGRIDDAILTYESYINSGSANPALAETLKNRILKLKN